LSLSLSPSPPRPPSCIVISIIYHSTTKTSINHSPTRNAHHSVLGRHISPTLLLSPSLPPPHLSLNFFLTVTATNTRSTTRHRWVDFTTINCCTHVCKSTSAKGCGYRLCPLPPLSTHRSDFVHPRSCGGTGPFFIQWVGLDLSSRRLLSGSGRRGKIRRKYASAGTLKPLKEEEEEERGRGRVCQRQRERKGRFLFRSIWHYRKQREEKKEFLW
jgi:hypothetical protein